MSIVELSGPESPLGVTDTKLKAIGALSYNGNYILAGGTSGGTDVLIDATTPASPQALLPGLSTGVVSIGSVGLSGSHAVGISICTVVK